jgi:hypothetical protein
MVIKDDKGIYKMLTQKTGLAPSLLPANAGRVFQTSS